MVSHLNHYLYFKKPPSLCIFQVRVHPNLASGAAGKCCQFRVVYLIDWQIRQRVIDSILTDDGVNGLEKAGIVFVG